MPEVRQLLRSGTGGRRCLAKTRACWHVSIGTSRSSRRPAGSTAFTAAAVSAASGAPEWTATARRGGAPISPSTISSRPTARTVLRPSSGMGSWRAAGIIVPTLVLAGGVGVDVYVKEYEGGDVEVKSCHRIGGVASLMSSPWPSLGRRPFPDRQSSRLTTVGHVRQDWLHIGQHKSAVSSTFVNRSAENRPQSSKPPD